MPERTAASAALAETYFRKTTIANVGPACVRTDLHVAPLLSRRLANEVWLKREDQQPVFSFKLRGAYNRIVALLKEGSLAGVVAASAGNHAQGVALAARQLSLPAVIVMPRTTPDIKVEAVRNLGAEVVLFGDDFDAALACSREIETQRGYAFIHPFDDADTIAGQGTVAREIDDQHPGHIDAVFICLGGGGLAAGMAAYLRHVRPNVKVIGVEPEDAACMRAAFDAGALVTLERVGLFADGAAVKRAGVLTYELCRTFLDDVITVSVDEIANAIKDVFGDTRTLIEPAGALAVAGIKQYVAEHGLRDQVLVATVSGANVSFDRLRHIVERTEVGEVRECLIAVRIPERPGSFREFCHALGHRSITEFNYRYAGPNLADVFAGIQLQGGEAEREVILSDLRESGYDVIDLSHNEAAELHTRYMIGGHLAAEAHLEERIFRCRFPERPGALLEFLEALPAGFNISLFHYRNHGAAYGRVLVGIQIPAGAELELQAFKERLAYPTVEETDNPALVRFLGLARMC